MKAIVIHGPGDLRIEDRDIEPPAAGEVQVRIDTGGICGSDLHYFNHGGFGTVRLKEPMILGHEVAGRVIALGDGVGDNERAGAGDGVGADVNAGAAGATRTQAPAIGQLVAVSPSRPCLACRFCLEGQQNQCLNMRFYGSAMPWPHIQGAFRQVINVDVSQCVAADGLSPGEAAMAEPFAVALHATRRAGEMLGKRVLVTGCGPIGTLSIIAAHRAGAAEIVATDLSANALAHAQASGADRVIDVTQEPDALKEYTADKGYFDILYECSGAASALVAGIAAMRPGGVIMQLGLGGDMTLPLMQITAKELQLRGSFRFHSEFATAIELMQSGRVDLSPLITKTFPVSNAEEAFQYANDRSKSMKAQISFTD